jgi:Tle cognate immunity protein 4 C-terminal domain/Tle cognate immunity protein 4 N-terminal domain
MSQRDYRDEMDARGEELKSMKHFKGYQVLYSDGEPFGKDTRYFVSIGDRYEGSPSNRIIEAFRWDAGYRIKLKIKGSDFTNPDQTTDPIVMQLAVKNDVPSKTRLVLELLEKVRGRAEDDIPIASGICFAGGFLPGKASDGEEVSASFFLKGKEDVSFDLQTDSSIQEPTTLLERGADIASMLKDTEGGRTVRKGRVDLPELKAEEWLTAGATSLDIPGHFFTLEANSKTGSAQTPLVILNMRNGGMPPDIDWDNKPTKASLSENEAIALWDVVSRTLRPRYNGF